MSQNLANRFKYSGSSASGLTEGVLGDQFRKMYLKN